MNANIMGFVLQWNIGFRCKEISTKGWSRYQAHIPLQTGLAWLPNVNEMGTNNMKTTWPMPEFCVGDPTRPIFHLFMLGVCVGCKANFSFHVEGNANMLVSPTQNSRIGGIAQGDGPTRVFSHFSGI